MLEVNEYHDGRVKSIGFHTATLPATVGVMEPGTYQFSTREAETMHVISGGMSVTLPDESEPRFYDEGDRFDVPGNSRFDVKITQQTAYFCVYH